MQRNNGGGIQPIPAIFFSLILCLLTGAIVFYLVRSSIPSAVARNQQSRRILELEEDIAALERQLLWERTRESTTTEATLENTIIVYRPGGQFSEVVRENLRQKLVEPFLDFYKTTHLRYAVIVISLNNQETTEHKYSVLAITSTGAYSDFLYGIEDPLEWWKPECLGECAFTEDFSQKYPQIVM